MKTQIRPFLLLLLCIPCIAFAQQSYVQKKFQNRTTNNLVYGIDTLYNGYVDTLKLDLYQPINDSNCLRPILVVVHGGAWIGGDKAGGVIPSVCKEFASRGYLVASINYRMGMHPTSSYTPYAICPHEKCSYVADTSEWYRAAFRAAQDVKSAVRFLKNRAKQDSADARNVFLLGESAGAFTAYLAAWMDQNSEKPAQAGNLSSAPNPDADLSTCVVAGTNKQRPDLGSINGRGNLGNMDASVKGVAAFYGGVFDTAIFRQKNAADTPVLYMYHQTCDVVVDNNKGRVFWKTFYYCYAPLNLCQPYIAVPLSWGSTAIKQHIDSMKGTKPWVHYNLINRLGSYSCDPSSNCHGIDNIPVRSAEVASFFSPVISASGNSPGIANCLNSGNHSIAVRPIQIYPNPTEGRVTITGENLKDCSFAFQGSTGENIPIDVKAINEYQWDINPSHSISNGLYLLHITGPTLHKTYQIFIDNSQ